MLHNFPNLIRQLFHYDVYLPKKPCTFSVFQKQPMFFFKVKLQNSW